MLFWPLLHLQCTSVSLEIFRHSQNDSSGCQRGPNQFSDYLSVFIRKNQRIRMNMTETMNVELKFVWKLLLFLIVYLFGLHGFDFYSLFFILCLAAAAPHFYNEKIATLNPNNVKIEPWWLEDVNVERVSWLNSIISNTWPHFQNYLSNILLEIFSSSGLNSLNTCIIGCI